MCLERCMESLHVPAFVSNQVPLGKDSDCCHKPQWNLNLQSNLFPFVSRRSCHSEVALPSWGDLMCPSAPGSGWFQIQHAAARFPKLIWKLNPGLRFKKQIKSSKIITKSRISLKNLGFARLAQRFSLHPQLLPSSTMAVVEANGIDPRREWRSTSLGLNCLSWCSYNAEQQHVDGRNIFFEMNSSRTHT